MIELYAFLSLVGIGYLLSKSSPTTERTDNLIPVREIPTSNTMYDSSFYNAVQQIEAKNANKSFIKSQDPIGTGVIGSTFRDDYPKKKTIKSPLSGIEIPMDDFVHSNMMPFFGSSVKQNVEPGANRSTLERFTGELGSDIYVKKKECKPLFDPQENVGNVFGNQTNTDYYKDRFEESRVRNNERPFEPVHVGPGLGAGYTDKPTGGYQQFEARDYIMPKTVDDLRVGTNPKETFEGVILPGMGTAQRGKFEAMSKNRSETFFENTPERYFTTVGAQTKDKQRPDVEAKDTNRQSTAKEYMGDVYAAGFSKGQPVESAVKQPTKQQLEDFGFRNVDGDTYGKGDDYDYGKSTILCTENERDLTSTKTYEGNLTSLVKSIIAPLEDIFKNTRKEYTVQNPRQYGQLQATFPDKITIYDPNQVARTTIKETNIHDTVDTGNIVGPVKLTVYDPDAILRTTVRETVRPMDTELNLRSGKLVGTVHLDDKASTTMKETLIESKRDGNIQSLEGIHGGYENTEYDAKITQKQFISDKDYVGGVEKGQGDGYKISPADAPDTQKQFLSDRDYFGVAESADNKKPMSYEDIMNATINELKETTLTGRNPTQESVKVASGKDSMNVYTRKLEVDSSTEREANNIEHIINQQTTNPEDIVLTKQKDQLEQQDDRLDINILSSLQSNPYAIKPLSS
jgi:Family of unknown function (DUF5899)